MTARTFTAFAGERCIASGPIEEALLRTKEHLDRGETETVVFFEDQTGNTIDFDLRGTAAEAIARLTSHPLFADGGAAPKRAGPGRPKLGVISREVSLLPRHWEWLEGQRGGISVTLRALVEEARKKDQSKELARRARDAAAKFMWNLAGNLPGFEEASRALYAKDDERLRKLIRRWPKDIRTHVARLAEDAARLEAHATVEPAAEKPG